MKARDFVGALRKFNRDLSRQEIKDDGEKVEHAPTLYNVIGNNIRKRRLEMGINQTEASQVLRIGRTSLTNIENGNQRCSVETLYLLAGLFDCTIYDLLPIDFPDNAPPQNDG